MTAEILCETQVVTQFPKASARIIYSEDGDEADVYVRPSAGTALKCIGRWDARALIYEDGVLIIWHQPDMYHRDVYNHPATKRPGDPISLRLNAPGSHPVCVAVKGDNDEPVPFTDERRLAILHGNRTLRQIYGDEFPVDTENWW